MSEEILKKKDRKDQLESYMLVKKLEKMVVKVKSEEVEEASEIAFQLLRNMTEWNGKYEGRVRKVM